MLHVSTKTIFVFSSSSVSSWVRYCLFTCAVNRPWDKLDRVSFGARRSNISLPLSVVQKAQTEMNTSFIQCTNLVMVKQAVHYFINIFCCLSRDLILFSLLHAVAGVLKALFGHEPIRARSCRVCESSRQHCDWIHTAGHEWSHMNCIYSCKYWLSEN